MHMANIFWTAHKRDLQLGNRLRVRAQSQYAKKYGTTFQTDLALRVSI